jgi:hypothetical protein
VGREAALSGREAGPEAAVCVSVLLKVCVCVSFIKKSGLSCRLLSVAYVPLFFTFTDIVFSYFFGSSIHIRFWSSRVLMN